MKLPESACCAAETYSGLMLWLGFFCVVLIYALFLITGDLQEDALITFRTALNLADHGELSFNVGEQYSGATSYLYPLWIAIIRQVAGDFVIPAVLIINSIVILGAGYLLAELVSQMLGVHENRNALFRIWIAVALTPMAILVSIRGMEAVYVILLFVVGLHFLYRFPERYLSCVPVVILPLVRPDAIAFSLILAGFSFIYTRRVGVRYVVAAIFGLLLLFALNYSTFGTIVPSTALAKADGVEARSFSDSLSGIVHVYFRSNLFSPVNSKYLVPLSPLFTVLAFIFSVSLLYWARHAGTKHFSGIVTILAGVWLVPGAFGLGGVVFPWYLWPSQFLYQAMLVSVVVTLLWKQNFRMVAYAKVVLIIILAGILGFQLLLSYNWGRQEMGFRASVGKYIFQVSEPGDSLFLEPAGYIPYYAKLKTIDEVGLTSQTVLTFKESQPDSWWIATVRSNRPTFLVQRDHILENKTYQGASLEPADAEWLWNNYRILKTFSYKPEDWANSKVLRWILNHGSHATYHVLQLR